MATKNHDQVFFINFGMVLAALFGIFFICILAARLIDNDDEGIDPEAQARLEERIKPPAQVITDPAVLVKMTAAAQTAREPLSGEQVYAKICAGCHAAGVLNAPKFGDKGIWSARAGAKGGLEGLTKSAIAGLNAMPPRGGDATLSDSEVHASVEHMLKQSGL